jgi:hypothetical protein
MITFRTSAEVTPERSIVLALPPETPLGKAELTVTISPREAVDSRSGNLRRHFGAIRSGDPRAADNDRIDADLAHAYEHSKE